MAGDTEVGQDRGEACVPWGGAFSRSSHWPAQRSGEKRSLWEPVHLGIWQVWDVRHLVWEVLLELGSEGGGVSGWRGESEGTSWGVCGGGGAAVNGAERSRAWLGGDFRDLCADRHQSPTGLGVLQDLVWSQVQQEAKSGDCGITFALWKGPWPAACWVQGRRAEETLAGQVGWWMVFGCWLRWMCKCVC